LRLIAGLALAGLLTACGAGRLALPGASGPPVPAGAEDTCGAAPYAGLVGQPDTALERVLILRQVRVLRPGRPAGPETRPARLTFEIAGDGTIARIACS